MRLCTINGCRVEEDRVEELREVFASYAQSVSTQEPGCLLLRVLQEQDDPTSFLVFAEFTDQAAYDIHLASDHVAELRRRLHPLIGNNHTKTILRPFE